MGINSELISKVTASQLREDIPNFRVGDTIRVSMRIVENEKERIQSFEGVVLRKRGHQISKTFTVRKIVDGISVERIFVLNSPSIARVEVIKLGKVRQARIYYMRDRQGKSARIKPRLPKVQQVQNPPKTKVKKVKPISKKTTSNKNVKEVKTLSQPLKNQKTKVEEKIGLKKETPKDSKKVVTKNDVGSKSSKSTTSKKSPISTKPKTTKPSSTSKTQKTKKVSKEVVKKDVKQTKKTKETKKTKTK